LEYPKTHPPTAQLRQEVELITERFTDPSIQIMVNDLKVHDKWLGELQTEAVGLQCKFLSIEQIQTIQQSLKPVYHLLISNNTILEKLCCWAKKRVEFRNQEIETAELCIEARRLLTQVISSINWANQLNIAYLNQIYNLLKQAEFIADTEFEGEISLLRLRSGWKVAFGTFTTEQQIEQVPTFCTFYNGLQWLLDEKLHLS